MAYLGDVGSTPSQSVEDASMSGVARAQAPIAPRLADELWRECDAAAWGLSQAEFAAILEKAGLARNFGLAPGETASPRQQAEFFRGLRLADLVLAQACARGHEGAWQHFIATYQQPLARAAIAITGNETEGSDLAGQLYAELYGLTERDGERRSPLDSYQGRGWLIGWLRTTLAQRHVDRHRRTHRESSLEEQPEGFEPRAAEPVAAAQPENLRQLRRAVEEALRRRQPEERFLLAAYYIDGRTLAEIGRVLRVHEATISRKLHRLIDGVRKQVLSNLQADGMSRRAAQESLGTDPRDLDLHLRRLLQDPQPAAFQEEAAR